MHIVKVSLTKPQHSKLLRGQQVQLKHGDLTGSQRIVLNDEMYKKYKRSLKNGSGCRIKLSSDVMEENEIFSGEGFKSFLKDIKTGTKKALKSKFSKDLVNIVVPHARDYAKEQVSKAAYYTEKQIESKLIKVGLPSKLVKEVVTHGATLTPMALNKIDDLADRLMHEDVQPNVHYEVEPVMSGNGIVIGGKLNFKKFFKKVGHALKPIAKPLLKFGANALISAGTAAIGAPQLSGVLQDAANNGIEKINGLGLRKKRSTKRKSRGKGLKPAGY